MVQRSPSSKTDKATVVGDGVGTTPGGTGAGTCHASGPYTFKTLAVPMVQIGHAAEVGVGQVVAIGAQGRVLAG